MKLSLAALAISLTPLAATLSVPPVAHAAPATAPQTYSFTVLSQVKEAGTRAVAVAIDFGADLPVNWTLGNSFEVDAGLKPVNSYAGDPIGNSAAPMAPRTVLKAYTSAEAKLGQPGQGRYVIVELEPNDRNGGVYYHEYASAFFRQLLPYGDRITYRVRMKNDLIGVAPDLPSKKPAPQTPVFTAKSASFRMAGMTVLSADEFVQARFEQPQNTAIKAIGYNFYGPKALPPGKKIPLVVFLHGRGQSHDVISFPNDLTADIKSPLLANQGGTTWVDNAREAAYVLVPQVPARDLKDAEGEAGWRSADTQKLLLGLVDKLIADNPAIDTDRLYLTGLSLGAIGSWKILTSADPVIAKKFAAAVLMNGTPSLKQFESVPNETPSQKSARITEQIKATDLDKVSIPLWLTHSNTDPLVDRLGARVPFATLSGHGSIAANGDLQVDDGVTRNETPLVRYYESKNRLSNTELRYTEYQFNDGKRFRDLGMVTPHGHFSWEIAYKDQTILDWMFQQRRKP